jgi:hypothetical protein
MPMQPRSRPGIAAGNWFTAVLAALVMTASPVAAAPTMSGGAGLPGGPAPEARQTVTGNAPATPVFGVDSLVQRNASVTEMMLQCPARRLALVFHHATGRFCTNDGDCDPSLDALARRKCKGAAD